MSKEAVDVVWKRFELYRLCGKSYKGIIALITEAVKIAIEIWEIIQYTFRSNE